jgi:hypothetical protein
MGLWGAAQAIAFGLGGFHRHRGQRPRAPARFAALAYATVFAAEACCSSFRPFWPRAWSRLPRRVRPRAQAMTPRPYAAGPAEDDYMSMTRQTLRRRRRRRRPRRGDGRDRSRAPGAGRCCCSTGPAGSSRAAVRFRHASSRSSHSRSPARRADHVGPDGLAERPPGRHADRRRIRRDGRSRDVRRVAARSRRGRRRERRKGTFERLSAIADGTACVHYRPQDPARPAEAGRARPRRDRRRRRGIARRAAVRARIAERPFVYAYHEIVRTPERERRRLRRTRCDVYYRARTVAGLLRLGVSRTATRPAWAPAPP